MLREFGVEGVKVQEVVSLDKEVLDFLPCVSWALRASLFLAYVSLTCRKPVYGVIFLFHWREDNPQNQEASCPDGIWFANQVRASVCITSHSYLTLAQTTSNACATVALLNIINNVEGIHLGEHLTNFRDFTMSFTPALRGDAVANFEFVKRIHNSFARYVCGSMP